MSVPLIILPGLGNLPPEATGAVVVAGSHGAICATYVGVKAGVRACILHDAGIGLDEAGIGGLRWAQKHGMAMATVATSSARIGDGADTLRRGVISRSNELAAACGVGPGQAVKIAAELLKRAKWPHAEPQEAVGEQRIIIDDIVCVDSITLAGTADRDLVVASGSHGGLPAADAVRSWKPRLALFNDGGFGADRAGAASLPILDLLGIAAATVAAQSARIGDGQSTLKQGVFSAVNDAAHRLGARVGDTALGLARTLKAKI